MSDLLHPEIYAFEARDFADWLRGGILIYAGAIKLPSTMRMPDAFPFAQLYIGRNEHDLAEDLKDIHQALPPPSRVRFERGVALAWSELEFREDYEFKLAEQLLILACRVRAKGIVDFLPGALPWLAAAAADADGSEVGKTRYWLTLGLRKRAFQAAVELAASSTEAVLCIERFVADTSFKEALVERNQALAIILYLANNARDRLPFWCAIFGNLIVVDVDDGVVAEDEVRDRLERAYGVDDVQRVIDMVRIDKLGRLATEREALSEPSMDGLYNLVSKIDSINAGGGYVRAAVTLGWASGIDRPRTQTAELIDLQEWRA